ncbi:MAG: Dabb family protein [Tannerellaceae bacterium]|nr:Dabb family protein [Tannerellaceae bacterium]
MIKHVVMFKLVEFPTLEKKKEKLNEIKERLEALIDKIDILRHIQVDFNVNPAETFDLILTTELDSLEDINTYTNHPEHVIVARDIIGPVKADRACVDYEFEK